MGKKGKKALLVHREQKGRQENKDHVETQAERGKKVIEAKLACLDQEESMEKMEQKERKAKEVMITMIIIMTIVFSSLSHFSFERLAFDLSLKAFMSLYNTNGRHLISSVISV